jgi:dTDP-4-dehydrorhamnose 3,5-epimerase
MSGSGPRKDRQTVTADWKSVLPRIDGVVIKRVPPVEDERGEICEVYRPSWGINPDPLVYVYAITIRPGKIKGWVQHKLQEDRIFLLRGAIRIVLFDDRPPSPTYKQLDQFVLSERNRGLAVFPRGVYHAIQNIGETEALFVNMPTTAYDHANPDKYRLPIKNDLIPFAFEDPPGW